MLKKIYHSFMLRVVLAFIGIITICFGLILPRTVFKSLAYEFHKTYVDLKDQGLL